jgi:hypothetical protein
MFTCGLIKNVFEGWRKLPSETEKIRHYTEEILRKAQYPLSTLEATQTENNFNVCSNTLTKIMKQNNNRYSIEIVGVWGTYASPIPGGTGTTTATVHIVFPDGVLIEIQYYATAAFCREIEMF